MELRQLGTTGMRVSELGLGTMTWGRDTDEIDAAEQFRDFLDAGGTLIDTSASYADGTSEFVAGCSIAEDGPGDPATTRADDDHEAKRTP